MNDARRNGRVDLEYYVHWIIFWAVVMGAIGIILQFVRYGGLMESGSIGPTGE